MGIGGLSSIVIIVIRQPTPILRGSDGRFGWATGSAFATARRVVVGVP